jgi:hypothetical protein
MPTLMISALMVFTAIWLPWGTQGLAAVTGTADWGAMATIAALLGVVLSFLTAAKVRALGLMAVGVLALVGTIIFITRLNGLSVGFGLIVEMLLSLAAIYVGFMDYSKNK